MASELLLLESLLLPDNDSGRHVHRDLPAVYRRTRYQLPRPVQSACASVDDVMAVHSHPRSSRLDIRGTMSVNYRISIRDLILYFSHFSRESS